MKYVFIIISLFLISGCISISHDLGNGYILGYGNNSLDRIIYLKKDSGGSVVTFYNNSKKTSRYFKNEDGIITSYISQIAFDNKYLIIDQKPVDSICECNDKCLDSKYPDSVNIRSYALCESGIKNSSIHYYYIIDKENNIIIGPIVKEKLDEELDNLSIEKKLNYKYYEY